MVLSLSTQGYQSILLSVSMHQNEPVKQSDMLSFFFYPLLFFCLSPAHPLFWFVSFYLSPSVSDCSRVSLSLSLFSPFLSPLAPVPSSPLFLSPFHCVRKLSTWIQFKSYPEKREQQQDFVNGNLIHGEQGVCNAVHVPGSCLIAFGFVQIWLLLTWRERENYTERDSRLIFHNVH